MKGCSLSALLVGIGFGLIFSYFFIVANRNIYDPEKAITNIPDATIIQKAKELGLIDPAEGIDKGSIRIYEDGKNISSPK